MQRKWGFLLGLLVCIIAVTEVYNNFSSPEEPKVPAEVVIKIAPPVQEITITKAPSQKTSPGREVHMAQDQIISGITIGLIIVGIIIRAMTARPRPMTYSEQIYTEDVQKKMSQGSGQHN